MQGALGSLNDSTREDKNTSIACPEKRIAMGTGLEWSPRTAEREKYIG